jgi:hypothetical protein
MNTVQVCVLRAAAGRRPHGARSGKKSLSVGNGDICCVEVASDDEAETAAGRAACAAERWKCAEEEVVTAAGDHERCPKLTRTTDGVGSAMLQSRNVGPLAEGCTFKTERGDNRPRHESPYRA